MDSMAATPAAAIPEVVDDGPEELTDPDDIDALMDSMVKESAVAELNDKPENFEISDPDDIDALLDSMADPKEVSKPITADDIIDPLDDLAADKLDENLDLTDSDEIDSLLSDIQGNEGQLSNEAPMQADTDITADEIDTTEGENKALIENFTNDYVAPFLSVDFSALLNDDIEKSIDDAEVSISENKNLSDELDIDALLAEVADSDNSLTNKLDIGDDVLTDGQANEQGAEPSTDYIDSDVLADLLADEKPTQSSAVSYNSESDTIEDLDNVDFDELLANIEEGQKLPSSGLDLSDDFTTDDIDLDMVDLAVEQSNDEIDIIIDNEEDFSLDLDDTLDIGDALDSDNNLNIDFDSDEDDFVSVDSLLSDSLSSTNDNEPYNKTDFNVGLSQFPEFSGDNSAEDEDDNGIAAKLDLAKVYIEIGDNENAEVILQDVVEKGDAQQQFDAQQLLDNISL
jgi:pilus assembly protein FimV